MSGEAAIRRSRHRLQCSFGNGDLKSSGNGVKWKIWNARSATGRSRDRLPLMSPRDGKNCRDDGYVSNFRDGGCGKIGEIVNDLFFVVLKHVNFAFRKSENGVFFRCCSKTREFHFSGK